MGNLPLSHMLAFLFVLGRYLHSLTGAVLGNGRPLLSVIANGFYFDSFSYLPSNET